MKPLKIIICLLAAAQIAGAATYCNIQYDTHFKYKPAGQMQSNGVFANYGKINLSVFCRYTGSVAQYIDGSTRQPGETWMRSWTLTTANNSESVTFYPAGGAERIYFDYDAANAITYVYADPPESPVLPALPAAVYLQFSDAPEIIPDADANGIPDASYLLENAGNTAVVYWGGEIMQRKYGAISVAEESGGKADRVECWPTKSELSAAKVNQNSRNVTWYCMLYDEDQQPYTDRTGNPVLFSIVPEWRRNSEKYEVSP